MLEFLLPFVLGFIVTWAYTARNNKYDMTHQAVSDLLISKFANYDKVVDVIREISIENLSKGDTKYSSVLKSLHDREQNHGTET